MKKIGIIGGINCLATINYYKSINEGVNNRLGELNSLCCIIYSINFQDIQILKWDNSIELFMNACDNLKKCDVDGIVLCSNTAHMFEEKLNNKIQLPIISVVCETAREVKKKGIEKIGLLGSKFTMEGDYFKAEFIKYDIECLIPESEATRNYIDFIIKEELKRGILTTSTKTRFIYIIKDLISKGVEGIVLGSTELCDLVFQSEVSVPLFNTSRIHTNAAIDFIFHNEN